ncbi:RNA polymerase sigma factor (sigma-70 family) [Natronobacillus azotifigens]|uniref:RNA polymerase sigma factor n=1 Tax=Natronobacillus azotifigens TaxID=472978 RepID=UPI003AF10027
MNEQLKVIHRSLMNMKYQYRQVIILRKLNQLSIKESAKVLGWPESKVKTTLHRALKELEGRLEREVSKNGK